MTAVTTPHSFCRFGLAKCDITPPVGIYHRMWGAATHDRSTGIHRPLEAAALAFAAHDDATGRPAFVLIPVDHCLFWPPEIERLKQAIAEVAGVPGRNLVITFSHTHGAGLMDPSRKDLPGGEMIGPYLEKLGRQLGELVEQAVAALQPVTITYAAGRCDMAQHRDHWDDVSKQFVCGFNPGGPVDDAVLVARVTHSSGKTVATIVNYGCHPTTLAWENTLISPDYPGAMRDVVEQATGAPCVFLLSPCGDIGPKEGQQGDVAVADRNGRQLGYAALSAWESLPPPETEFVYQGPVISGATLGDWRHQPMTQEQHRKASVFSLQRLTIPLPYRPDRPSVAQLQAERTEYLANEEAALQTGDERRARDWRALVERLTRAITKWSAVPEGENFPYHVVLMRVGEAVWLTFEGEPYQLLQRELRQRFAGIPLMMAVISDGWRASYLVTRESYGKNIYQETVSILGAGCLETLIEETAKRVVDVVSS
jgi:hypothetical protein